MIQMYDTKLFNEIWDDSTEFKADYTTYEKGIGDLNKVDDKYVYGILNKYSNGFYEVMGIVENLEIPSGSKVVTTGLGNIFPSGLLVGYVDSIETDNFDLSKVVKVKSDVLFDDISYVTIVKRDNEW